MSDLKQHYKPDELIIGFVGPEILVTNLIFKVLAALSLAVCSFATAFFFLLVIKDVQYGFGLSLSEFGPQGLTAFYSTMPWVALGLFAASLAGAYLTSGFVRKILAVSFEFPHKQRLATHLSILAIAVLGFGLFLGSTGFDNSLSQVSFIDNMKSYEHFDDDHLIIGVVQEISEGSVIIVDKHGVTYDVRLPPGIRDSLVDSGVVVGSTIKIFTDKELADSKFDKRVELASDVPILAGNESTNEATDLAGYGDRVDANGNKVIVVDSAISIVVVPDTGSGQDERVVVIIPEDSPNYTPPADSVPTPAPAPTTPTPAPAPAPAPDPVSSEGWNQVAALGLPSSITNQRDITQAIAYASANSNASVVRVDLNGEWYHGSAQATSSKPITVIIDLRDAVVDGLRAKRASDPGMAHELWPKSEVSAINNSANVKVVYVGNNTLWKNARTHVNTDATFYGFTFSFKYDTWARVRNWPVTGSINGSTYPGNERMAKSASEPRIFDLTRTTGPKSRLTIVNSVFKDYMQGVVTDNYVNFYGVTMSAPSDNGFTRAGAWTYPLFKGYHQPAWWGTYLKEGRHWQNGERGFINKGAKEGNYKDAWMGSDPGDMTHAGGVGTHMSGTTTFNGVTFLAPLAEADEDRSNKAMTAYPRYSYHTTKLVLNNVDIYGGGWNKSIFTMSHEGGGGQVEITINGKLHMTEKAMHRNLNHFSHDFTIRPGYSDLGLTVNGSGSVSTSAPSSNASTTWLQTTGKNINGLDSLLQAIR